MLSSSTYATLVYQQQQGGWVGWLADANNTNLLYWISTLNSNFIQTLFLYTLFEYTVQRLAALALKYDVMVHSMTRVTETGNISKYLPGQRQQDTTHSNLKLKSNSKPPVWSVLTIELVCFSLLKLDKVSCDLLRENVPIEPVPPITWKPDCVEWLLCLIPEIDAITHFTFFLWDTIYFGDSKQSVLSTVQNWISVITFPYTL